MMAVVMCLAALMFDADLLEPGTYTRVVDHQGGRRTYLVHVPMRYDPATPTPVVLAFHGLAMPAGLMAGFTGLDTVSELENFVVVYPCGTGTPVRWNSGGFRGQSGDDVGYVRTLLDDLGRVVTIDQRRVYATGMSNGAMMCYRLASELSDRIAAIAPVAGTMALPLSQPGRPVPVIHFHGTLDRLVPYHGPGEVLKRDLTFTSVKDSVETWARWNECRQTPLVEALADQAADDECKVERSDYGSGRADAEVVLYTIQGGGHTWPGRQSLGPILGNATRDIDASQLIWDFFEKHPMPDSGSDRRERPGPSSSPAH